jgi:deoxyribodipyrimidine photolyase-related protein
VIKDEVTLVFPHQLFRESPALDIGRETILIEEFLFFKQYNFHKQKIKYHRATMKFYETFLRNTGFNVTYIQSQDALSDIRKWIDSQTGLRKIYLADPTDDWLIRRIQESSQKKGIEVIVYESPLFINSSSYLCAYFEGKKRLNQTQFYIDQRQKYKILLDKSGQPLGGKWTFDTENRKPFPKKSKPPSIVFLQSNKFDEEASEYVIRYFGGNFGEASCKYPSTYEEATQWLDRFLEDRFNHFGDYEDAIVGNEAFLHHSVLTPMLNIGLLHPRDVIESAIKYAEAHNIPINNTEGFVRQILGWREFIRAIYILKGREQRIRNFWRFHRKIDSTFYTAQTSIVPVDTVIRRIEKYAYAHHIERLMILGNFMLLSEIRPKDVYRWFMEVFIDAYDWVMVPNIYGMSQFADGGLMSTKPYISGSNYVLKMSDFSKGEWCSLWDSLFWRFMDEHRSFFKSNPRLNMLISTYDKWPQDKKEGVHYLAQKWLNRQM